MNRRVGILGGSLQEVCPRGLSRVARAFAERLAGGNLAEMLCLTGRISDQPEVTYTVAGLDSWLAANPLRLMPRWLLAKRVVTALCPPAVLPVVHAARDLVGQAIRRAHRQSPVKDRRLCLSDLDAVLCFDPYDAFWDLPLERYTTRKIGWFHDAIPLRIDEGGATKTRDHFRSAISRMVLRADRIVCVSASAQQDLVQFFRCPPEKASVIHNGHDLARFCSPAALPSREVLERYQVDPRLPFLLSVGAIERRKNVVNILRACRHLHQAAPGLRFQLVIAGDRRGEGEFRELFADLRRTVPIVRTGYVDDADLSVLVGQAAAFLYPSLWEGFGIPVLEAMSAGALVIASDTGALPEVCGPRALYCDPYDPVSIASAMRAALDMSAVERSRRTEDARLHASNFTWERAAAQLACLLRAEMAHTG